MSVNAGPFSCDADRLSFLTALDQADVEVSDWEAEFIGSCLNRHTGAVLFSDKQRQVIWKLYHRYAMGACPAVKWSAESNGGATGGAGTPCRPLGAQGTARPTQAHGAQGSARPTNDHGAQRTARPTNEGGL